MLNLSAAGARHTNGPNLGAARQRLTACGAARGARCFRSARYSNPSSRQSPALKAPLPGPPGSGAAWAGNVRRKVSDEAPGSGATAT